ncbi:hypothetical protein [Acinetobacter guerrae]|uniref:hypothetical protein n=1 Tax=Acinetobacter guerrae TaxID=1843371 RepID=UPI00165175F0|nr:hypothetical protein [Acinetobacter guerrae]
MKTVLVILTHANLGALQVNESIAATMVFATFGTQIKVLLQDAALSLLNSEVIFDPLKHAFKAGSNMVESFEFYDLSPIMVESRFQDHPLVRQSQQEIEFIELNAKFIQSFNYVLYW